jgi:hypothetical protein
MIIMQNVDSVMLPRLVTAALAELLLHTGSALEWLAPDVLAAKKKGRITPSLFRSCSCVSADHHRDKPSFMNCPDRVTAP